MIPFSRVDLLPSGGYCTAYNRSKKPIAMGPPIVSNDSKLWG